MWPTIITAGASLLGNLINSFSTARTNKQQLKFSEHMYDKQKADNLDFWGMQNNYNSPQSQMQRFQDAGLNKNLIYGQGNSGNAGSVQTPDVQAVHFQSPQWGDAVKEAPLAFMNAIYELDQKKAQTNLLQTQADIAKEEFLLRINKNQRVAFDLAQDKQLAPYNLDLKKEQVRQTRVGTDLAQNRDLRDAARTSKSLQEMSEKILNLRADRLKNPYEVSQLRENISLMRQRGIINNLDIDLKKMGLNPNSPLWATMAARIMNNIAGMKSPPSGNYSIWDYIFNK